MSHPDLVLADLVLAFHGTEKPAGQRLASRVVLAVAAALPQVRVHLGWADVLTPTLTQTLSAVGPAVVVPCFLASGYHVTSDLPAAVQASGGHARLTPSLGAAPEAVLAARLAEAGGPGDAVVLAAAGSKRDTANRQAANAAARLARQIGRPVCPAFVTAAAPSPAEAVAALRAAGYRRVAIASFLLAPGVFHDRLQTAGADLVSEPIGDHPLVIETIVDRYRQALAEGDDLICGADDQGAIA